MNNRLNGIPFIGETCEKKNAKRESGGDELAYKMKQMGEIETQRD